METAKIFWSGQSQAVRLPKDFRFDADTVRIRRHGNTVILEPVAEDWSWLDAITNTLDADAIDAANEKSEQQERSRLDSLFK
jgi:antitoxin VapB